MSQQVISYADLSVINSALRSISSDMAGVHSDLGSLNFKQDQLGSELDKLATAFANFVAADGQHKALQLAETRVGNLRQDLQIKYGYYAEIRRMATGILQSVDTGIVSDDTLRFSTEEIMIKAPGYWLAPALIVLSAWIRDDKNNSEKALTESLKRDDYKTTLFFMLVMRRLGRNGASMKWLERYFTHQNPHYLDREFIVILEAVTTGVFPPAARQLMMTNVKNWIVQLSQTDNFINEQKNQWITFFRSAGQVGDTYPLLKKFAANYTDLESALRNAKSYQAMLLHFNNIFSSSADLSKVVRVQLDEILTLLVTNFDEEELPLQKQVRLNQLIIEMDGDKAAAQLKMDAEQHIFDEQVDFLQLLTNAAFNPKLSGATKATQALAVSISQPWIIEAHDTFTAQNRNTIPPQADLAIDGFNTSTANGEDETEQLQKQEAFYQSELARELSKLSFPSAAIAIGVLICLGGLWGFTYHIVLGIVGLGIGAVMILSKLAGHKKDKQKIAGNVAERESKAKEVLRGCIAEMVDYRKEYAVEDGKSEQLRELLNEITPQDFSSVSKETARNII